MPGRSTSVQQFTAVNSHLSLQRQRQRQTVQWGYALSSAWHLTPVQQFSAVHDPQCQTGLGVCTSPKGKLGTLCDPRFFSLRPAPGRYSWPKAARAHFVMCGRLSSSACRSSPAEAIEVGFKSSHCTSLPEYKGAVHPKRGPKELFSRSNGAGFGQALFVGCTCTSPPAYKCPGNPRTTSLLSKRYRFRSDLIWSRKMC